jgi:hypothetical protein
MHSYKAKLRSSASNLAAVVWPWPHLEIDACEAFAQVLDDRLQVHLASSAQQVLALLTQPNLNKGVSPAAAPAAMGTQVERIHKCHAAKLGN